MLWPIQRFRFSLDDGDGSWEEPFGNLFDLDPATVYNDFDIILTPLLRSLPRTPVAAVPRRVLCTTLPDAEC